MLKLHKSLASNNFRTKLISSLIIVIVALIGIHTLSTSHATSSYVAAAASGGTLSGNAIVQPGSSSNSDKDVVFSADPNFKGIIEFAGSNSSTDATDSNLVGINLVYYWSQIEPSKGDYNWSLIKNDMQPWIAAGKKVVLRISASGQTAWDTPYSGNATPQWVYAEGVPSVTELDGSISPQYWNPIFLAEFNTFIQAFAAEFDGNPNILFIQAAVGMGGEILPDTYETNANRLALWQTIGYTDPLWNTTLDTILGYYTSAFHNTPLAMLMDSSFLGNTSGYNEASVSAYGITQHFWLQDDGLTSSNTDASNWSQTTHTDEQRNSTENSGDSLLGDMTNGLDNGTTYLLIYQSDIVNPANQSVIAGIASQALTTP